MALQWLLTWQAMVEAMEADSGITSVMGTPPSTRIYMLGERQFEVPSITGLLVVETEDERWNPCEFQLDIYTRTVADMAAVEYRVRRLFHHDVRTTVGDMRMFAEFLAGRSSFGPATDQYFRRSLDFRMTPIRDRYVREA